MIASSKGLGAVLLQDDKPVAFASKALNNMESRYANIEREMLAVLYGCERFHTFLFGRQFTVHTGKHKSQAPNPPAPPRLQRMLLRLQPYDVVIKYKPGKQMDLAVALSRLLAEEKCAIPDMNVEIHQVCPQFSTNILERIRTKTGAHPELVTLKEEAYLGWPSKTFHKS